MANYFRILALRTHEQYEKAKRCDTENGLPRLVGAQYTIGEEWRNNSRKDEEMEPKKTHHRVVDVTGDRSSFNAVKSNIA